MESDPVRLDSRTYESFKRTFAEATRHMNDEQRTDMYAAIASIWVIRGNTVPLPSMTDSERVIREAVHGMTAEEILSEAQLPAAIDESETMSKEDRERWYEGEQPRFGDPNDYLPPNTIDTMPCEYSKGDMHDILIFAAKGTIDEIGRWYTTKLPIHIYEKHDYDPGQRTLYSLRDRDSRSYSVILADSETEDATGNFGSYVGPEYLERMIKHRPCVIGALYLSEDGWYERNAE